MTAGPMTVQVTSILVQASSLTVFSARCQEGGRVRVVATGKAFLPVVGEVYEITGEWRHSERYGDQIHGDGDGFKRLMPSGALLRPWLERIPGVGPERAKRLVRAFKGDLARAFDGAVAIEALADVIEPERPNLATRVAAAIVQEWARVKGEYKTLRWLEEQGIEDLRTARSVAALLGPQAVEILRADPYVLASVVPWTRLDPLALRLLGRRGDVPDADTCAERIVGAVDVVLHEAVRDGHTAVPKAGFEERVAHRLGLECDQDLGSAIIGAGLSKGAIVDAGDRWRMPGCAIMEEELLARFAGMAAGQERSRVRIPPPADLRRILAMVERRGRTLFPEQREAVLSLVARPVSCLSGGAGTGKTTTCRAVTELWETLGGRVELAALSGKAALRLGEGVGRTGKGARPAHTIHKLLLGLRRRGDGGTHWGKLPGEEAPDPATELPHLTDRTLLVIDEASMVDLGQMHEVIEAMPPGCRLMLVGDDFQLPPVGFGLVFHHLVAKDAVVARLEVVRRQEEASGIPAVASAIRSRATPMLPAYEPGRSGVSFLSVDQGGISTAIERVVGDLGGFGGGSRDLMVLAAVNRRSGRPDGTVGEMNVRLQARERGSALLDMDRVNDAALTVGSTTYAVGDPVTHLRNDYGSGLRNGSLGTVTGIDLETRTVVCTFDGEDHGFTGSSLLDIGLAYALTCHKAQGSQARNVVISLADAPNVEPTWLYTAVTRAVETAVIVGEERVLGEVMRRMPAFERRMTGCTFDLPPSRA